MRRCLASERGRKSTVAILRQLGSDPLALCNACNTFVRHAFDATRESIVHERAKYGPTESLDAATQAILDTLGREHDHGDDAADDDARHMTALLLKHPVEVVDALAAQMTAVNWDTRATDAVKVIRNTDRFTQATRMAMAQRPPHTMLATHEFWQLHNSFDGRASPDGRLWLDDDALWRQRPDSGPPELLVPLQVACGATSSAYWALQCMHCGASPRADGRTNRTESGRSPVDVVTWITCGSCDDAIWCSPACRAAAIGTHKTVCQQSRDRGLAAVTAMARRPGGRVARMVVHSGVRCVPVPLSTPMHPRHYKSALWESLDDAHQQYVAAFPRLFSEMLATATSAELDAAAERCAEETLRQLAMDDADSLTPRRGAAVKRRERRERRERQETTRAAETTRVDAEDATAAAALAQRRWQRSAELAVPARTTPREADCFLSECPVCLEQMHSPVLCLLDCGHCVCGSAKCSLLTRCPVCRRAPTGSLKVYV